ncbi:hypothetical protein Hte_005865 [Hypoxylon texense]
MADGAGTGTAPDGAAREEWPAVSDFAVLTYPGALYKPFSFPAHDRRLESAYLEDPTSLRAQESFDLSPLAHAAARRRYQEAWNATAQSPPPGAGLPPWMSMIEDLFFELISMMRTRPIPDGYDAWRHRQFWHSFPTQMVEASLPPPPPPSDSEMVDVVFPDFGYLCRDANPILSNHQFRDSDDAWSYISKFCQLYYKQAGGGIAYYPELDLALAKLFPGPARRRFEDLANDPRAKPVREAVGGRLALIMYPAVALPESLPAPDVLGWSEDMLFGPGMRKFMEHMLALYLDGEVGATPYYVCELDARLLLRYFYAISAYIGCPPPEGSWWQEYGWRRSRDAPDHDFTFPFFSRCIGDTSPMYLYWSQKLRWIVRNLTASSIIAAACSEGPEAGGLVYPHYEMALSLTTLELFLRRMFPHGAQEVAVIQSIAAQDCNLLDPAPGRYYPFPFHRPFGPGDSVPTGLEAYVDDPAQDEPAWTQAAHRRYQDLLRGAMGEPHRRQWAEEYRQPLAHEVLDVHTPGLPNRREPLHVGRVHGGNGGRIRDSGEGPPTLPGPWGSQGQYEFLSVAGGLRVPSRLDNDAFFDARVRSMRNRMGPDWDPDQDPVLAFMFPVTTRRRFFFFSASSSARAGTGTGTGTDEAADLWGQHEAELVDKTRSASWTDSAARVALHCFLDDVELRILQVGWITMPVRYSAGADPWLWLRHPRHMRRFTRKERIVRPAGAPDAPLRLLFPTPAAYGYHAALQGGREVEKHPFMVPERHVSCCEGRAGDRRANLKSRVEWLEATREVSRVPGLSDEYDTFAIDVMLFQMFPVSFGRRYGYRFPDDVYRTLRYIPRPRKCVVGLLIGANLDPWVGMEMEEDGDLGTVHTET